jgi:Domain of unknown function (DUF1850)
VKLLLAAALAALAVAGGGSPQVVARTAGGETVASLPAARGFALEYLHSYYRRPARETFRVDTGGGFELVEVASPSEAVLDYYEIEGSRARRGGWWTLRPARAPRFESLALAATRVGRRTLVAGGRRAPLYSGGAVHLRIGVER